MLYVPGSSHPKHRLDVYAPTIDGAPFVHFVHGGYWTSGDKNGGGHGPGLYASIGEALAAAGIGSVIQSYRLAPEVGIVDMVDDIRAAIAWTVENVKRHRGDPERVFMMGHSAGGHLVALLGADPARRPKGVRGYIPLSAIWDVADMHDRHPAGFNRSVTYPVFGESVDAFREHSPATYLSDDTPPMLIAVGSRDFPYMIPQAETARAALTDAELVTIAGNTHMDMVQRFGAPQDNMTPLVADFVR